jgi:hypothetical protein
VSRYIKKFGRIGHALGPSEERGFALWAGYDIEGVDDDLSEAGFIKVDGWSEEQLQPYGITTFTHVAASDEELLRKLGVRRDAS